MSKPWEPADHGSDSANLRRRTARATRWALIDNWGRQLLQLLVFVILARLLPPQDFGLVALAMVFVMLASLFVDQGMGDAIIQRRVLEREHLDSAFWAALSMGAVLTAGGVVLAIPIATLLGEPRLQPVLQALSLAFLLTAVSAVPMGILRREMRFRSLALRTMFSIVGGGAAGVFLALAGYGVWALVVQQLLTAVLSAVALMVASPWRPRPNFSRRHFRDLFGYGANIVGGDLLGYFTRYSDNLLIGAVLGTPALGHYAIAYRILDAGNHLLHGIARKVAFPALSRLQHEPTRLQAAYFRITRVTAGVVLPAYVGMALVAPELIRAVFGGKWDEAVPVAAVLFLVGPALAVQGFGVTLLSVVGRPDIALRLRLVNTITAVTGFALAVSFGIVAVAAAFVVRGYLMVPLQLFFQRRYAGIPTRAYLSRLRGTVAATVLMAGAVLAAKWLMHPRVDNVVLLLVEFGVGAAAYVGALYVLDRALLHQLIEFVTQALPGGERAQQRFEQVAARRGRRSVEATLTAEERDDPIGL
ncbi:MAG TPA: lipopolysaccharide biosynthesis protein [Candidatus Limnocylindria bacterium]|nr:lipopolysaccharide biosynthesis protein [Candidatus Limnocylindria bacterium]